MKEILETLVKIGDRPMALGLATLICLSQRENTSVAYQHKEMNFSDVPIDLVADTDALTEDIQMDLVAEIAINFMYEHSKPGAIA